MRLNIQVKRGTTRWVLLIGKYALKFPRIHFTRSTIKYSWKLFLSGLLGNMQENEFGRCGFEILCPVIFRIPGGFLTIMPRAAPLTVKQWQSFDFEEFFHNNEVSSDLAECKKDSYGVLNDKIVVVDYG